MNLNRLFKNVLCLRKDKGIGAPHINQEPDQFPIKERVHCTIIEIVNHCHDLTSV